MRTFDENKVVDVFHPGKAVIGGRYFVEDNLMKLKKNVLGEEDKDDTFVFKKLLTEEEDEDYPFICEDRNGNTSRWAFLYPYEEEPSLRMTNAQLQEWLARGNGVYKEHDYLYYHSCYSCPIASADKEVGEDFVIRPFGTEEWIEPTVEIYKRDCK